MTRYKRLNFRPNEKTSFQELSDVFKLKLDKNKTSFYFHPVSGYTIISYLPFVLVLIVMKILNLSPIAIMYILRFVSLMMYLALIYQAIKITPIKKWLFFALAVLPMGLYEASAVSTDSLAIGLSFLFIAYTLNLSLNNSINIITKKQLSLFGLLISLITIIKFAYMPLGLLYFIIPKTKFKSFAQRNAIFALIFVINILIAMFIVGFSIYLTKDAYAYFGIIDKNNYIQMIVSDPIGYISLIISTLIANSAFYLSSFVGLFGWLDTAIPNFAVQLYSIMILIIAVINDGEDEKKCLPLGNKIIFSSILILALLLIMTSVLLIFGTSIINNMIIIKGVQGRYFIPVALMFFLLFYNNKINLKRQSYLYPLTIFILVNCVLFVSAMSMLHRYYL